MTAAQQERGALVATFRAVGPHAPTLCEGWNTTDLAAHLVVRERRLDATIGITVPFLAGYTAKIQDKTATSNNWDALVDLVASGPPIYSPFKLLDPVANLGEMFIHHEDVRRAAEGWEPRELDETIARPLRRQLGLMSRLMLSKLPAQVDLETPSGERIARVGRGDKVVITGEPQELLLFVAGRDAVRIHFDGDEQAVAAVQAAPRGL
jgi:uncharacterized protein (TIGR03085 family)